MIQSYANLEQSLCLLFVHLTGMPLEIAAIIFFKIVNAATLFSILEKLLRKKHGATYSLFWNSFLGILRAQVTPLRNQIVHWNAVDFAQDMTGSEMVLMPPTFYLPSVDGPQRITVADMSEFRNKCYFLSHLCDMFLTIQSPAQSAQIDAALGRVW